jgi:hypothetical protein
MCGTPCSPAACEVRHAAWCHKLQWCMDCLQDCRMRHCNLHHIQSSHGVWPCPVRVCCMWQPACIMPAGAWLGTHAHGTMWCHCHAHITHPKAVLVLPHDGAVLVSLLASVPHGPQSVLHAALCCWHQLYSAAATWKNKSLFVSPLLISYVPHASLSSTVLMVPARKSCCCQHSRQS